MAYESVQLVEGRLVPRDVTGVVFVVGSIVIVLLVVLGVTGPLLHLWGPPFATHVTR